MFTDIEGSTRLLRSLGDDYGTVLRAHRAIVRAAVALEPASAALGRDVLAVAADDLAGGRAMTFDQVLDYAAAWAGQRSGGTT